MQQLNAPCKGCTQRTTGDVATSCHETCEKYLAHKNYRKTFNYLRAKDAGERSFNIDEHIGLEKFMKGYKKI